MKNVIRTINVFCVAALALTGCKESERLVFDEPASIYFYSSQWGGDLTSNGSAVYGDSLQYTFLGKSGDFVQASGELRVLVTGYKSDKAREIRLSVDPQSTLQPGTDYILPDPILVPANALEAVIPITFKRTDKLRSGLYRVKFTIVESADLKPGYDDYTSYKFVITEKAIKPSNWQTSYYGDYSAAKLRFMYSILGTNINWGAYPPVHMANSAKLRQELAKYERANGPLYGLAEDGEENIRVTFPG